MKVTGFRVMKATGRLKEGRRMKFIFDVTENQILQDTHMSFANYSGGWIESTSHITEEKTWLW